MRLIILDRDGVINEDSNAYIKSPDEWKPIPGSAQAIARLHRAGYRVVVTTNQSGIGRGLFDLETLGRIHEKMHRLVDQAGGKIDAVAFCPHKPGDGCECRKPKPGLLLDVAQRLSVCLDGVPSVGDSLRDLRAARSASALPILVRTGKGARTLAKNEDLDGVSVFDNLAEFVDYWLNGDTENRP